MLFLTIAVIFGKIVIPLWLENIKSRNFVLNFFSRFLLAGEAPEAMAAYAERVYLFDCYQIFSREVEVAIFDLLARTANPHQRAKTKNSHIRLRHNLKRLLVMARPIKATPALTGADARRFEKAMENVKKISPEKRAEYEKAYEWFKRAAKFPI